MVEVKVNEGEARIPLTCAGQLENMALSIGHGELTEHFR